MKQIGFYINAIKKNKLVHKALVDTNYYMLAQLGSKLLGLLIIPFLVRILSVEEFARYDIFLIFSSLTTTIVVLGIDSGIAIMVADYKENKKLLNFLFSYALLFTILSVFFVWVLSVLIFPYFDALKEILVYIHLLFLYVLFNIISYQVFNFIRWIGRAELASIISFVSYAVGVIFGFSIIYFKPNPVLSDYLAGLVFGNFLGAVASILFCFKHLSFRWQPQYKCYVIELIKVSLPFVPNYLTSNLMMMSDRLVVVSLLGEKALGIFALANRFAQIPNFGINIITRGFHPVMYLNYKEDSGKMLIKKVYELSHLFLIPAMIVMFLCADPIVSYFGGLKYTESVPLIPIITITTLIQGIKGLNGMGYNIARKTYFITLISLISIILNIGFNYILGTFWGVLGISLGSLLVACIVSVLYTYYSEKLYSFKLNIFRSIIIYMFIIIIASFILFF